MAYIQKNLNKTNIVIIGAGVAGLSAAEHLFKHGYHELTILEGADRIGGRVHTVHFGQNDGDIVELGANWIHGGCAANSMFNLANKLGILSDKLVLLNRVDGYFFNEHGKAMEKTLVDKVYGIFTSWEQEQPSQINHDTRQNMYDYLCMRLKETLPTFEQNEQQDVQCIFNCLMNYCQFHNGGFMKEYPMPDPCKYVQIPGGNVKVPDGISSILKGLIRNIPFAKIKLQTVVKNLDWGSNTIMVECQNGAAYQADHIICTMSLGCLKKAATTMFQPSLPQCKLTAIQSIPFGKVGKIFLQWVEPFWHKGTGSIKLAWTDKEVKITCPKKEWYKKIYGFDEVLNNPNVLVGWISGHETEHMEQLPDEVIIQTCTSLIRTFCGDASIPAPTKVLRTEWCTNPFTCGSYSCVSFETSPENRIALSEPVNLRHTPKILFAGEATSGTGYSTMHGARSSGIREAERLMSYFAQKDNIASNL